MNAARMETIARFAKKNGISKTVKQFLNTKGGYCYSFKESQAVMRNAVRKAVKWFDGRQSLKTPRF
jgi:hypothetical protein